MEPDSGSHMSPDSWIVEPARLDDLPRLAGMHVIPSLAGCLEAPRREPARWRYYRDKLALLWRLEPAGIFLVRVGGVPSGFMLMTGDVVANRRAVFASDHAWRMWFRLVSGRYGFRREMVERFAVLAGQGLGLLRVRRMASAPCRQRAHIFGGIVAEEERGRGILKALHKHSGRYARACGADRLSANILPENLPALAAARWIGFAEAGRSHEVPGDTIYLERTP